MVQLRILSGPLAGGLETVRHFPFHIGRAPDNDLSLDADGVWNYHLMLDLQSAEGFVLRTFDGAFAAVNDQTQASAPLRNGDVISFGSVKLQFWLAASRQRSLRAREWFVWSLLLGVTLGQIALIYWLLTAD
jgi:pSer/pThr/pTyr-binding forkhead associated (FHA) protein